MKHPFRTFCNRSTLSFCMLISSIVTAEIIQLDSTVKVRDGVQIEKSDFLYNSNGFLERINSYDENSKLKYSHKYDYLPGGVLKSAEISMDTIPMFRYFYSSNSVNRITKMKSIWFNGSMWSDTGFISMEYDNSNQITAEYSQGTSGESAIFFL